MTMPQQPQVNVNINQPSIPQQPMAQPQNPIRQNSLRTKRGLLKYLLLGLVTFGIYDIWQMSEVGTTLNLIATRRDGKRTMHYCLMFFLLGWLTLGIGWLVWYHKLSSRIGTEQAARGLPSRSLPQPTGCGTFSALSSSSAHSFTRTSFCTP